MDKKTVSEVGEWLQQEGFGENIVAAFKGEQLASYRADLHLWCQTCTLHINSYKLGTET